MDKLHKIAYILLIIGGINWGMIGLFDINVIGNIFSQDLSRIIYSFVGVAALVGLYSVMTIKNRQTTTKKK